MYLSDCQAPVKFGLRGYNQVYFTPAVFVLTQPHLCSVRNSMSYLRPGRGPENRRSVFYTGSNNSAEEWELVDAPPKDFLEPKPHPDTHRRKHFPRRLIHPLSSV